MKKALLLVVAWALAHTLAADCAAGETSDSVRWRHLSTVRGDLPVPNAGSQQTSSIVCDIDGDLDTLGKPYAWETPRLDVWISQAR